MKKFTFIFLSLIIFFSVSRAQDKGYLLSNSVYVRGIDECIKHVGDKDNKGNPFYYTNRIYIKIKKDISGINKSSDVTQSSVVFRFNIPSIDEKISKYRINKVYKTFKQRAHLLKKNADYAEAMHTDLPDLSRIYTLEFSSPDDIRYILNAFGHDVNIEYAEPVPIMYPTEVPNDSLYSQEQHLPQIHAEEAWNIFKGQNSSTPIIIGVCDTGVEWDHPDLRLNLWQNLGEDANHNGHVIEYDSVQKKWVFDPGDINNIDDDSNGYVDDFIGWDFLVDWTTKAEGNDPMDYYGHGTHVAGISAGCTNNDSGIASISWNVKFLPTSHSSPDFTNIEKGFEGIVYLAENGADVINCSWGGGGYSSAEAESIAYATGIGAIVITAAGNSNQSGSFYPASYPHIISVASVASSDKKASYSNYGIGVDISAPGGDGSDGGILSTVLNYRYSRLMGTSMASPVAAGCMGLLKSYHPDWTNDRLISQFLSTTDDIDSVNPNYINQLGTGRVNPFKALIDTNASIPRNLKLELTQVITNDSIAGNNNGAIEPGETVNLGFIIRNYMPLNGSKSTEFTIQSLDPDIEVVRADYADSVNPDGFTEIPAVFQITVAPSAVARFAKLRLTAQSSTEDIIFGSSMDFEIPITTGGVFVYDGIQGGRGYSGAFIRDFLKAQGINVIYSNTFPSTLFGFDYAFLCFGTIGYTNDGYSASPTGFDDWMAAAVKDYLEKQGKVYIEGTEALGWDQRNNQNLLDLFGIKSSDDGADYVYLDTLEGQLSAITNNMQFFGSRFITFRSVDNVVPGEGTAALVQPDYGTVGLENIGFFGQKTFYSSYPIAELYDGAQPSTRYELIQRIMNFFGMGFDYVVPGFDMVPNTGHAPLNVKFTDKSLVTKPVSSREWIFGDSSGDISNELSPQKVYYVPGIYTPQMTAYRGNLSYQSSNNLYVFDGESALDFDGKSQYAVIQPNQSLNLSGSMTIEAWIKPRSSGSGYAGRIVDKNKFLLYIGYDNTLRFLDSNDAGQYGYISTRSRNAINYNEWQHVAVTYDGDSTAKLYVNGVEMEADTNYYVKFKGKTADNSSSPLFIGNNSNMNRPFDGEIDEVRIWNKARTKDELIADMNVNLNGNEPGLEGYWQFQEGNGSLTKDETTNNDTATVYSEWREGWHPGFIKSQPQNVSSCANTKITFTVQAVGGDKSLTYKWHKDADLLSEDNHFIGADSAILTIKNIKSDDEGNYYCIINANPGDFILSSDTASLSIIPGVTILKPQTNNPLLVASGGSFILSVSAMGEDPLKYQWYENNLIIPGANREMLQKFNFSDMDTGKYYCLVSNVCDGAVSDTFVVRMTSSGVDDKINLSSFEIMPNPFSGNASINFRLDNPAYVTISVTDILGKSAVILYDGYSKAGYHNVEFNSSEYNLSSGVYLCTLTYGFDRITKLMNLIK